jgi:hypothetical protein
LSSGAYPGAPSYTVWTDGAGNYYAKDAYGYLAFYGTNASLIIQQCMDTLPQLSDNYGGLVQLTRGIYFLDAMLSIAKGCTLYGENQIATTLRWSGVIGGTMINITTGKSNVQLENLYVDCYDSANIGIEICGGSAHCKNVNVIKFLLYGFYVHNVDRPSFDTCLATGSTSASNLTCEAWYLASCTAANLINCVGSGEHLLYALDIYYGNHYCIIGGEWRVMNIWRAQNVMFSGLDLEEDGPDGEVQTCAMYFGGTWDISGPYTVVGSAIVNYRTLTSYGIYVTNNATINVIGCWFYGPNLASNIYNATYTGNLTMIGNKPYS